MCYCLWCSALGVVAVVLKSRCVVLCTVCEFVSDCIIKRCILLVVLKRMFQVRLFIIQSVGTKFKVKGSYE